MVKLRHFFVQLDTLEDVKSPGDTVKGAVYVTLNAASKMRSIYIKFLGRAQTSWSENSGKSRRGRAGDTYKSRRGRAGATYKAEQMFINEEVLLYGLSRQEDGSVSLAPGEHKFPFELLVPDHCPVSYEGKHGFIRYSIKAIIDKPWKFDHEAKVIFTVDGRPLDLNQIPSCDQPVSVSASRKTGKSCLKPGEVTCSAHLPYQGLVPGQSTHLTVSFESTGSGRDIRHIEAVLCKTAKFIGHKDGETKDIISKRKVAECIYDERISTREANSLNFEGLVVPSVPKTLTEECEIIKLAYNIEVNVELDGLRRGIELNVPVTIGNIPLKKAFSNFDHSNDSTSTPDKLLKMYPNLPWPHYEGYVFGVCSARDEEDGRYVTGQMEFAPRYLVYQNRLQQ